MDWGSQLVSSTEAAVEDSAEETARLRTMWFGEEGRRRIERVEDMVRRDPVWAEKLARRHAAFREACAVRDGNLTPTTSSAPTSSVDLASVPDTSTSTSVLSPTAASTQQQEDAERYKAISDAEANAADRPKASSATSPTSSPSYLHAPAVALMVSTPASGLTSSVTSERAMSIQTAAATDSIPVSVGATSICQGIELALATPITCSMVCPGEVPDSAASPPPIPVAVVYSSVTRPAPYADIQLVREDNLQPAAFTGSISAPPSVAAHEADLTLTRVAVTSATPYAMFVDHDYYLGIFCDQVHIGHEYNLGVFLEQVRVICYLNLDKVCSDYSIRRDLGEIMMHQGPWDPGGSTWHRLEVKPKFKEGGMLVTSPTATTGLGLGCHYWAWATGKTRRQRLQVSTGSDTNRLAWNWTASASFATVSSPSRVTLLPSNG